MNHTFRCLLIAVGAASVAFGQVNNRSLTSAESVEIQARNGQPVVSVSLDNYPSGTPELRILQGEDFVAWQAPLQSGAQASLQAPLDSAGANALVLAPAIAVAFTDDEGEAATVVRVPRSAFVDQLAAAEPAVSDQAPFFESPEQPAKPERPDPQSADLDAVQAYAADIRAWDAATLTYAHRFAAAHSRAHALWLDLHTAGEIPWSEEVVSEQRAAFAELADEHETIMERRAAVQQEAREFVNAWREQNPDVAGQVNLTFVNLSAT